MAILDGLNDRQKEAVLSKDGPLLVIAGAGSGKTKTITHRIAYLISQGVDPRKILAVTFTNKAAEEMKERVQALIVKEKMVVSEWNTPFIGTFHALGVSILRSHGSAIGIPKTFSILDEEDTRQIFKDLVKEHNLDPDVYAPQRVRSIISRLKQDLTDPALYAERAESSPFERAIAALYFSYEDRLGRIKALDFDDLLMKVIVLFERSEEARTFYENRWDYIHIDEYQDTNQVQYLLSRTLARRTTNITVVGDVDQAIYSWRGADWRNILQFEEDWENAKVILLEENYRSTEIILEAANAVIEHNTERKEKILWTQQKGGEKIGLIVLENERAEALFIAEYIRNLKAKGAMLKNIAVLFRTNAQSRAVEEMFLRKNIPYRLVSGVRFYERKEIKDVLGYLKYVLNPSDTLSKKRILNVPVRGIGKVTMLKYLAGTALGRPEREKIERFEAIISKIREDVETLPASRALKNLLEHAGFSSHYKGNKLEEDRWENIQELLSVAQKFDMLNPPEGIERLLTEAALLSENTEVELPDDQVSLLTTHAAKGLEYAYVIIAGMEEGLFPHSLSETSSDVEEERRLFYVALTRAKEKLVITLAHKRMLFGETSYNDPSRFLKEIPEHLLEATQKDNEQEKQNFYEEDEVSLDW